MSTWRRLSLASIVASVAVLLAAPAAMAQLPARSNDGGGVRIVVTPKQVGAEPAWDFEVVMDTHSKPLDADLAKNAVLIDGGGQRYAPLSLQGDPPGGHHRKVVLRFPKPAGQDQSFEVRIQGVGGVDTRVFQWTKK